jgi:hypothetical protein
LAPQSINPPSSPPSRARLTSPVTWAAAALVAALVLTVLVRLRLLGMPLERDEGEFAYLGQLMLEGVAPYKLAFNIKLPGIYAAYAAIMAAFGESPAGIHFGFLLANLGTLGLLFFVARRFLDRLGVLVCCTAYALYSMDPTMKALQGHATHLVNLAALGGLALLLRAREKERPRDFLLAGLLLGGAFLCKQPGIFFAMFAGSLLLWDAARRVISWRQSARRLGLLCCGFMAPFAAVCVWMWAAGTFDRFWFWTMRYPRVHVGAVRLSWALMYLQVFFGPAEVAGLLATAFGLFCLLRNRAQAGRNFFLTGLLLFSAASVGCGLYFFGHYFITALPAASLLIGAGVSTATDWLGERPCRAARLAPLGLFVAGCLGMTWINRGVWLEQNPDAACATIYRYAPFVECRAVAAYIGAHSTASDQIVVVGSEPEIYFYAHRRSASGYLYAYDLVALQPYALDMQREFIVDVQTHKPKFLVYVHTQDSWMVHPGAEQMIFDWSRAYTARYYDLTGLVVLYPDFTKYYWGKDASLDKIKTDASILVFRRKQDAQAAGAAVSHGGQK